MKEKVLKLCQKCGQKAVNVEFLGKTKEGTKLFSSKCLICGYDYVFCINHKFNRYYRTGNLQE